MRDVRVAVWIGLCGITLFVGCGSSDKAGAELNDGAGPDQLGADTVFPADLPIDWLAPDVSKSLDTGIDLASLDAPPPSADAPFQVDAPSPRTDGPIQTVDAPSGEDGLIQPDGHYYTITDGRRFLEVDFCLPILPLPSGSLDCPATLDDARAALRSAQDGGVLDARPLMDGRPEMSEPCAEPLVVYLPNGQSLGWGRACYYDARSGQLLSITAGSDTPTECVNSPIPNTAAFTAQVYGQHVTCTWPGSVRG